MKYLSLCFLIILPIFSDNLKTKLDDLQESCRTKIVQIEYQTKKGIYHSGQGFFISKDGYLLTAKHVIKEVEQNLCYAFWIDKEGHHHHLKATCISEHPTLDVALLKTIDTLGQDFPCFELESPASPLGTWVFLSYFDADHITFFLRGGKILHLEKNEINMSIRSCPGDSGSPCVLSNGKVIGLNCGTNYITNICLPFSAFYDWLLPFTDVIGIQLQ